MRNQRLCIALALALAWLLPASSTVTLRAEVQDAGTVNIFLLSNDSYVTSTRFELLLLLGPDVEESDYLLPSSISGGVYESNEMYFIEDGNSLVLLVLPFKYVTVYISNLSWGYAIVLSTNY